MANVKTYVLYNESSDIDEVVTGSVKDMIEKVTELIDDGHASHYNIFEYDAPASEYNEGKVGVNTYIGSFTPESFCKTHKFPQENTRQIVSQIMEKAKAQNEMETKKIPVQHPEKYHNMSDDERIEVLHYCTDQMILDELQRRFKEYRTICDGVVSTLDKAKIYK